MPTTTNNPRRARRPRRVGRRRSVSRPVLLFLMNSNPSDTNLHSALTLGIETSGLAGSIALCRGEDCLSEALLEEAPRRPRADARRADRSAVARGRPERTRSRRCCGQHRTGKFHGLTRGSRLREDLGLRHGLPAGGGRHAPGDRRQQPCWSRPRLRGCGCLRGDAYVRRLPISGRHLESPSNRQRLPRAQFWFAERAPGEVISGPGLAAFAQFVPPGCRQLPAEAWTPRSRVIAQLGLAQLKRGDAADCATLVPFYLRRSAAEERKARGE